MRIGVISDSHGDRAGIIRALNHMSKVDVIFHLGDFAKDGEYIKSFHPANLYVVRGNCDFFADTSAPVKIILEIGEKKIFATHGHRYRVKDGLNILYYKALETGADIVLYGHTHSSQIIKVDNRVIMNPGSVSRPRDAGNPTYGIIEITKGNIKADIMEF